MRRLSEPVTSFIIEEERKRIEEMPRAFLITHKRRFEEGLEAPMQTSVSSHGPWDGEKIEGGCEPMTDSNMLDHTMRGFRGGSSGSSSGDSGVGSPGVDPGRLPDSPRSESALRETPSSVLGEVFFFFFFFL